MKKKLVIVTDVMTIGGVEKVIIDTLIGLDYSKFDVTLFVMYKTGHEKNNISKIPENVKIKYLFNKPIKGFYQRILFYILMFFPHKLIRDFLVKEEFDVVVTTKDIFSYPFSSSNAYKVMWIHGGLEYLEDYKLTFLNKIKIRYKKFTYSKFDQVLLLTQAAKNRFCEFYSLHERCNVLHNPINDREIIRLAMEKVNDYKFRDRITIVCSCRLSIEKGVDRLLNACAKLANEGYLFHLLILGDGPEKTKLTEIIHTNKSLQDKADFLGFKENPYKYLKKCNIYVSPSLSEGFSLSIAEAIILELPILSTECHGPSEILDNGKFGLVVKNSEDHIYEGLRNMLSTPELIDFYKSKSKVRKEFFAYEKNIRLFEELISSGDQIKIS
ncbi:glycosyltransferase [Neobacillus drentensis]|uniref:glycosyltransferase n=1 Tax=Neobacillus drentensis TaxID=220684 RepID=UPI002864E57B|nr:glycosyltransferase [Neobacillus drentensis]MDR7239973.1 glycosyltransferase involved in cell wall biosynthesis [Neobacillus drentensis]